MIIRRLKKTAMPARLGELDGIVHPMPVLLTEEAQKDYPYFDETKMMEMVNNDKFLHFLYSELGSDESSLRQIHSVFVLEDEKYCKEYNLLKVAGRYDHLPDENKGGNCFGEAFNYIFNEGLIKKNNNLQLVHAIICPLMGPLSGISYGHAWVEDGDKVIDTSRNNKVMDKETYYILGGLMNFPNDKIRELTVKEENIHRYSVEDARKMALDKGMYGPWEESFDEYVLDDEVDHDGLDQHK